MSFLGDSLAFVVLSLEIARSDRPILMTLLLVAFASRCSCWHPLAGRLVDEHDSRTLLVAAGGLQVVASLGLVWGPNPVALLGFVLLLQAGQSVTGPTWGAVVPRIVGDELVGKAVGVAAVARRPSPAWAVPPPEGAVRRRGLPRRRC